MGDLLIRNISEALKRDITAAADKTGRSLSDEAKELLRKGLVRSKGMDPRQDQSAYKAFRSAFVDADAIGEEFSTALDDIEIDRKRNFGRSHESLE